MAVDVSVDDDVTVPDSVRGLGKCPDCTGRLNSIPVSGVAPQADGQHLILDSIMMMPIDG